MRACLIGQGNGIFGVCHRCTVVVGPTLSGIAVLEIDQALGKVGRAGNRNEEESKSEMRDSGGSRHEMGIGWGVVEREEESLCQWFCACISPGVAVR